MPEKDEHFVGRILGGFRRVAVELRIELAHGRVERAQRSRDAAGERNGKADGHDHGSEQPAKRHAVFLPARRLERRSRREAQDVPAIVRHGHGADELLLRAVGRHGEYERPLVRPCRLNCGVAHGVGLGGRAVRKACQYDREVPVGDDQSAGPIIGGGSLQVGEAFRVERAQDRSPRNAVLAHAPVR